MIEGKLIGLLNYNAHRVYVKTPLRMQGVAIPHYENGMAGLEKFSVDEIRYINQISAVIRNGEVRIEEEYEEEVKQLLGIYAISDNDWTPEEMYSAVLKPTPATILSLTKITSAQTLDAFLSVISGIEVKNEYMISGQVRDIIIARKAELLQNKNKSEIEVVKKTAPTKTVDRNERVTTKKTTTTKKQ